MEVRFWVPLNCITSAGSTMTQPELDRAVIVVDTVFLGVFSKLQVFSHKYELPGSVVGSHTAVHTVFWQATSSG
eukprot:scaffold6707_cov114-Cylindrotheca_fusiformis.AAC.4